MTTTVTRQLTYDECFEAIESRKNTLPSEIYEHAKTFLKCCKELKIFPKSIAYKYFACRLELHMNENCMLLMTLTSNLKVAVVVQKMVGNVTLSSTIAIDPSIAAIDPSTADYIDFLTDLI